MGRAEDRVVAQINKRDSALSIQQGELLYRSGYRGICCNYNEADDNDRIVIILCTRNRVNAPIVAQWNMFTRVAHNYIFFSSEPQKVSLIMQVPL